MGSILRKAAEFILEHRRRRRWFRVVTSLAMVVVFITTYLLILPAITIERSAICGMEEHTHTVSCYEEYEELVCGLDEDEDHEHDESCYDTFEELVCGMVEHIHDESCFATDVKGEPDEDLTDDDLIEDEIPTPDIDSDFVDRENGEEDYDSDITDDNYGEDDDDIYTDDNYGDDETGGAVGDTPVEPGEESEPSEPSEPAPSVSIPSFPQTTVDGIPQNADKIAGGGADLSEIPEVTDLPGETEVPGRRRYCNMVVHKHSSDCYDENGVVICRTAEHKHNDDCYGPEELENPDAIMPLNATKVIDGVTYAVYRNATGYTYTLSISMPKSGTYVVPSNLMDNSTISQYRYVIAKVEMPENATKIVVGASAFRNCTYLEEVIFPQGAEVTFEGASFSGCVSLKKLNFEDIIVKEIKGIKSGSSYDSEGGAFYNTNLKEVYLTGTSAIEGYAFYQCTNLEKVVFGENCTLPELSYYVFANDLKIKEIDLTPLKNLKQITDYAFSNTGIEVFTIPKSVTDILRSAFRSCASLVEINYEEGSSLQTLRDYPFGFCGKLKTAYLPRSIINITYHAFYSCGALEELVFEENCQLTNIYEWVFYNDRKLKSVNWEACVKLNQMANHVFDTCSALTELIIPETVTDLRWAPFARCSGLTNVVIRAKRITSCHGPNDDVFQMYNGAGSSFPITIANTVDGIDGKIINSPKTRLSGLIFEGPNEFSIFNSAVSTSLPAPLDSLQMGNYYASEAGDLYLLNNDKTATLVYLADPTENFVVPEFVGMNGNYKVTSIGDYAFAQSNVRSIDFENIDSIKTIGDHAFTNATHLNNVCGETTIEDVIAMFEEHGVTAKESAFINTAFGVEEVGEFDETKKLGEDEVIKLFDDQLQIRYGTRDFLTGDSLRVNFNLSDKSKTLVFRIYFECDDQCTFLSNIGDVNSIPVSFHDVPGTNCHYYELGPVPDGKTLDSYLTFDIANNQPDGKMRMWAMGADKSFWDENDYDNKLIMPSDEIEGVTIEEHYFETTWSTEHYEYPVYKSFASASGNVILVGSPDGASTVANLTYNVGLNNTSANQAAGASLGGKRSRGADYVKSVEYEDTFELPEGLKWRDGLTAAIQSGNYEYRANSFYVTIGETEYLFATLTSGSSDGSLEINSEGKVVIKWQRQNSSATCSAEISAASAQTTLTFGNYVIEYDEDAYRATHPDSAGDTLRFRFTNDVHNKEYYYYYDGVAEFDASVTHDIVISENGDLTFEKKRFDSTPVHTEGGKKSLYFGEESGYTITLENVTAFTYDLNHVSDPLDAYHYIKPDGMKKMFDEAAEYGDRLEIVINNAKIVDDIPDKTVTAVDKRANVDLSVQDTGDDTLYGTVTSTDDHQITNGATIVLSSGENGLINITVSYEKYGEFVFNEYTIGDGGDFQTIEDALNQIGYVVNNSAQYTPTWYYDYGFEGGGKREYNIYSYIKNSFMLTDHDTHNFYGNDAGAGAMNTVTFQTNNTATAYDSSGNVAANSKGQKLERTVGEIVITPDMRVSKGVSVNGNDRTNSAEDGTVDAEPDDTVEYSVTIEHYGTGSYETIPVVDVMTGSSAMLALVSENRGAPWISDATEYISPTGTHYYALMPPEGIGETYEYKGVWIGEFYAESISVTRESDTSIKTIAKWYLKDTTANYFKTSIPYKVITDAEFLGTGSVGNRFDSTNIVYLNDRESQRLWDKIAIVGFDGVSFDKKIVTERGAKPSQDQIDADNFSKVFEGDTVTYRLEFRSGKEPASINGASFYDELPSTAGLFAWSAANVQLEYVVPTDSGVEFYSGNDKLDRPNGSEYRVVNTNPSNQSTGNEYYYIDWNDDFRIDLQPNSKVYIYVTLTFPTNSTNSNLWDRYLSAKGNGYIYNTLVAYDYPKRVSHVLSDRGPAFLQKGVYETGIYTIKAYPQAGENGEPVDTSKYYKTDRFTYVNDITFPEGDADVINGAEHQYHTNSHYMKRGMVAYYITIKNSSKTRMYLNSIYDRLPEGFEFYSLRNNAEGSADEPYGIGNVNNKAGFDTSIVWRDNIKKKTPITNVIGAKSIAFPEYNCPTISVTDLGVVDGHQMLKFDLDRSNNQNVEGFGYDSTVGLNYLEPGYYFDIVYECFTGDEGISPDIANNAAAMELVTTFQDYYLDNDSVVNVSDYNGLLPYNDGERYIWNNSEARNYGFDTGTSESKWLASSVDVYKGDTVIPGITKDVEKRNIEYEEIANWNVTVYNDGSDYMKDWTFVDTIEAPQHFTGSITYESYFINANGNPERDTYNTDRSPYLLRFERADDYSSEQYIRVYSNFEGGPYYDIPIDPSLDGYGEEQKMIVSLAHAGMKDGNLGDRTIPIYVTITKNEISNIEGTETIKIRFEDPRFSIPPGGYVKMKVKTKNPTGTYKALSAIINQATVIPSDEYNRGLVTKGEPLTDESGKNAGVTAMSYIMSDLTYPTSSLNEINEVEKPENHTTSESVNNRIVIPSKKSVVHLNHKVINSMNKDMEKLVIIDNLPEEGDEMTISDNVARGSQFRLNLYSDPSFTVKMTRYDEYGNFIEEVEIPREAWKIQYSTKTDFDTNDWSGSDSDDWKDYTGTESEETIQDIRSVRLVIDGMTIPAYAVIDFGFDAIIYEHDDSTAEPGEVAWDSFGYQYDVMGDDGTTHSLFAGPMKVGVEIPDVPELVKALVKSNGEPAYADKEKTFGFVIYEGEPVTFVAPPNGGSKYAVYQIAGPLTFQYRRKFTYVTVTVRAGESISDALLLDNLVQYEYSMGSVGPTETEWVWNYTYDEATGTYIPGKYSIVEVDIPGVDDDNEYNYKSTTIGANTTTQRNASFTYAPNMGVSIKFTNERPKWGVKVFKMDEEETPLTGALFGIYSPYAADALKESTVTAALKNTGVPDYEMTAKDIMTVKYKGETYYLHKIESTTNGRIDWSGALIGDNYIVKEIRPPDGYYIPDDAEEFKEITYSSELLTWELDYINITGQRLPDTGGSGLENAIKLLGIMTMAFALSLYGMRFLRKRFG